MTKSPTRNERCPVWRERHSVGSFSSCPVLVAHHLSASGFVLTASVWKRRTLRRGVEVRLRQLPCRPVLRLCRPLCWWSVSLFDLRAVSSFSNRRPKSKRLIQFFCSTAPQ